VLESASQTALAADQIVAIYDNVHGISLTKLITKEALKWLSKLQKPGKTSAILAWRFT
jgi:hypothetical protein